MKKSVFVSAMIALLVLLNLIGTAFADGLAPVAENFEIKTYRNTAVEGRLTAYDPEQDIVSFEITTFPRKGEIRVEQNGDFIYKPFEDKKGRDYFGYKAIDSQGNVSQEGTAIIRIDTLGK